MMIVISELMASAIAEGGAGATLMPNTVNATTSSDSAVKPIFLKRVIRAAGS